MALFDVSLYLSKDNIINHMEWESQRLFELYADIWHGFLYRPLGELFPSLSLGQESLNWGEERFSVAHILSEGETILLLARQTDEMFLYQRALDEISEGIQIYDKNAHVVYFNKASRKLSDIPKQIRVEGRHLQELYELDAEISTVMTSLRTGAPVINRFDTFQSKDGTLIKSTNTAYPIFRASELLGSVVFEQDSRIVEHQITQLKHIQDTLEKRSGNVPPSRFTGYTLEDVIGTDPKIRQAVSMARRVAAKNCNVLLVGETGTGKEIFAQGIHRESSRKDQKFVAINCAAIPDQLIEGLFFGTKKGSYTGSMDQSGYAEEANGGTMFLDELNSMSLGMQAKLLRVIQEGTFRRVGSDQDIKTDLRILASCNEDPFELIAQGRLRKDLFYRLSTIYIDLPPLREHLQDLPILIDFYFQRQAARYIKALPKFRDEVLKAMNAYSWPGNVRELFHVLEHILNVIEGLEVTLEHLPKYLRTVHALPAGQEFRALGEDADQPQNQTLQAQMDRYEAQILRQSLERNGYNITRTAQALGLLRQSLQYRIQKYGIVF